MTVDTENKIRRAWEERISKLEKQDGNSGGQSKFIAQRVFQIEKSEGNYIINGGG
mgnify:CR=1 FL=1